MRIYDPHTSLLGALSTHDSSSILAILPLQLPPFIVVQIPPYRYGTCHCIYVSMRLTPPHVGTHIQPKKLTWFLKKNGGATYKSDFTEERRISVGFNTAQDE